MCLILHFLSYSSLSWTRSVAMKNKRGDVMWLILNCLFRAFLHGIVRSLMNTGFALLFPLEMKIILFFLLNHLANPGSTLSPNNEQWADGWRKMRESCSIRGRRWEAMTHKKACTMCLLCFASCSLFAFIIPPLPTSPSSLLLPQLIWVWDGGKWWWITIRIFLNRYQRRGQYQYEIFIW